jgi:hypothetical protein
MVYIPRASELEQSAALLTSLQSDVSRLNKEKSATEQLVNFVPLILIETKTAVGKLPN